MKLIVAMVFFLSNILLAMNSESASKDAETKDAIKTFNSCVRTCIQLDEQDGECTAKCMFDYRDFFANVNKDEKTTSTKK